MACRRRSWREKAIYLAEPDITEPAPIIIYPKTIEYTPGTCIYYTLARQAGNE
jgi:hypothetical protein